MKVTSSDWSRNSEIFNQSPDLFPAIAYLSQQLNTLPLYQGILNSSFVREPLNCEKLKDYTNIVFLGTGGSSLGGQVIYDYSLKKKVNITQKLWFLDNADPKTFFDVINSLSIDSTAFVVISKSGHTMETIAQLLSLQDRWPFKKYAEHFYLITEDQKNPLREWSACYGIQTWDHPHNVGGRFSVFTIVGQIPALLSHFDWRKFQEGAQSLLKLCQQSVQYLENLALTSLRYTQLAQSGIDQHIVWSYGDCLRSWGGWFAQLSAESLGKKDIHGTRHGCTPVLSYGTVDQHSQLQLYLDGPRNKMFTFLHVQSDSVSPAISLPQELSTIPDFQIYNNRSLKDVFVSEFLAIRDTIAHAHCPYRVITLSEWSEKALAELMILNILETEIIAYLTNVNPFDQPAVEDGKKRARDYLTQ